MKSDASTHAKNTD